MDCDIAWLHAFLLGIDVGVVGSEEKLSFV